jgi:hypothetical protein
MWLNPNNPSMGHLIALVIVSNVIINVIANWGSM